MSPRDVDEESDGDGQERRTFRPLSNLLLDRQRFDDLAWIIRINEPLIIRRTFTGGSAEVGRSGSGSSTFSR